MAEYVKQLDIGEGENAQSYTIKDAEARDLIEELQAENESLKEQITQLNDDLSDLNDFSKTIVKGSCTDLIYGNSATLRKEGNVAFIEYRIINSASAIALTPSEAFLKLPDEFKPSNGQDILVNYCDGSSGEWLANVCFISSNGEIYQNFQSNLTFTDFVICANYFL